MELNKRKNLGRGVVKLSACSSSTPTTHVRILLKPTVFTVKFVFEKMENKEKEAGIGPFFKKEELN